jgi:lysophospholipase L1-like esterase
MLVRFHSDVITLQPRTVHIMAGTNDVAGNAGPTSEQAFQDNIHAMVEMARAHGIRVVLASIPPAAKFTWRPELQPAKQISELNRWMRDYARRERIDYLDYYSVLATADGALKTDLSIDGVHPNRDGYAAMRALATSVH